MGAVVGRRYWGAGAQWREQAPALRWGGDGGGKHPPYGAAGSGFVVVGRLLAAAVQNGMSCSGHSLPPALWATSLIRGRLWWRGENL